MNRGISRFIFANEVLRTGSLRPADRRPTAASAQAEGRERAGVPRETRVDGASVSTDEVRAAHLAWYAEHPDAVDAGLARHAGALATLGLR